MKNLLLFGIALALAISVAGCNTPQGQNTVGGAVVGGTTGAVIGAVTTGNARGALLGGAIGTAAGALIGSSLTPQDPYYGRQCARYRYDYYGNVVGCRYYY